MKKIAILLLGLLALVSGARAENDGDCIYTLLNADGEVLTRRAGRMYEGDEYISGNNRHYRIAFVDDNLCTATAEDLGPSIPDAETFAVFMSAQAAKKNDDKLICMYSTHSDESYVPSDGASSLWENAGIYDVGDALKENLEKKGITVEYSEKSFLPHDADAYNRSRSTVEEYVKQMPDAIIDIHRDGVDAEEYETEVDGEDTSMVRLFVGRSNQNSAENKAFAQRLKSAADEAYPGLIKDIYIGKGNYNQELYPQAILLEFGTHEIEKEKAISATEYMADVIDDVLFGGTASAATGEKNSNAAKGIGWAIGIAIVGAAIYAMFSAGSIGGAWSKMKSGAGEMTAGLFGKKK
ncbi:MAG: stage II sporulation protein P [Clostridia bacterium]|nr:stage II sporulation protein P [Clostridia bacterium]